MGNKCKDCKYLDFSKKTSVGFVCTNQNRDTRKPTNGSSYLGYLKTPTTKACKSGFKPRKGAKDSEKQITGVDPRLSGLGRTN